MSRWTTARARTRPERDSAATWPRAMRMASEGGALAEADDGGGGLAMARHRRGRPARPGARAAGRSARLSTSAPTRYSASFLTERRERLVGGIGDRHVERSQSGLRPGSRQARHRGRSRHRTDADATPLIWRINRLDVLNPEVHTLPLGLKAGHRSAPSRSLILPQQAHDGRGRPTVSVRARRTRRTRRRRWGPGCSPTGSRAAVARPRSRSTRGSRPRPPRTSPR